MQEIFFCLVFLEFAIFFSPPNGYPPSFPPFFSTGHCLFKGEGGRNREKCVAGKRGLTDEEMTHLEKKGGGGEKGEKNPTI